MLKLIEPTLLLDKNRCVRNINMMAEKAKKNNLQFRPHFKTHQAHAVGRWFREAGVTKITVSSLEMAEYFAQDGWNDITVAFPVNVHEKDRINKIAARITLNLLVIAPETVSWLAKEVKHPLNIFIEADNGYHRTGVSPSDFSTIDSILNEIKKHAHFRFAGFLSHAGHSYKTGGDKNKILAIHKESIDSITPLKEKYKSAYPHMILSIGDTPTCSLADQFPGIDEIRPGNFVFYDYMQVALGSCTVDQVAVALACPVVATYPERNEIAVHGGGIHFSKDSVKLPDGSTTFGKVVGLTDGGWSTEETNMFVKSLSQEHGIIHAPKHVAEKIKIGDFIGVLPVHSCMTVDVMRNYLTVDGERFTIYR